MTKRSHKSTEIIAKETATPLIIDGRLLEDIRGLIESAKSRFAQTANAALVTLYWNIGNRIKTDILGNERAQYGREIVSALSGQLTAEYGKGFSRRNLFYMIRFAEVYPEARIVHALSAQLSWTHFRQIIYIEDDLKRDFYAEMCRVERWSTRTLHDKMQGMLYERTAISRKPAELVRQELDSLRNDDRMTPALVFRDPYLLDFLGLSDTYSERDLESGILKELEHFLLELGTDFYLCGSPEADHHR